MMHPCTIKTVTSTPVYVVVFDKYAVHVHAKIRTCTCVYLCVKFNETCKFDVEFILGSVDLHVLRAVRRKVLDGPRAQDRVLVLPNSSRLSNNTLIAHKGHTIMYMYCM